MGVLISPDKLGKVVVMALTTRDYRFTGVWEDDDGQEYANVFYYKANGASPSPTASDLAAAWAEDVAPFIAAVLHNSMTFKRYTCENLVSPGDFTEGTIAAVVGERAGEHMPNFVGWAFRVNRPTKLVRNGRKNFGRVSESDVENGVATEAPGNDILVRLIALSGALTGIIFAAGSSNAYELCIPQSVDISLPGGDPVYELDTLWVSPSVIYNRVSTQNSRKNFS